jgi:hypothetical protein
MAIANEYAISPSPVGVDLSALDTTPRVALGSKIVTRERETDKERIYRYVRIDAAYTAGVPVVLSSVNRLVSPAGVADVGQSIAVPQVAIASPAAGPVYGAVQTGGYFDEVGILCSSAVANAALYLGATGAATTVPGATAPVRLGNARALSNATADEAIAYSREELTLERDLLA